MDLAIFSLVAGLSALGFATYSTWSVLKKESGTPHMREISDAIREGAQAYLHGQLKTITIIVAVLTIILAIVLGAFIATAFVLGAFCSTLAGYVGMKIAVRANVRTAHAARTGLNEALHVAFRGGSVTGMMVIGLGLLGIYLLYLISGNPSQIVGFGFGASLIALLARVGGGIYTKAADVGADLVGKVEKGIPEDDPRNPAVIADLVGDNVGDVAGMGSDLFESYVGTILAAMLIGIEAYGKDGVVFPLLLQTAGIFSTIVGILSVRPSEGANPQSTINRGMFTAGLLATILTYFLAQQTFGKPNVFYAALTGIATAIMLGLLTQYYTSSDRPSVQAIAKSSQTGPAITILTGLAMGMRSVVLPILVVCGAIFLAFEFAELYGIAIAAMGMLSVTGVIVTVDSFGSIVDNAGGIVEMSGLGPKVREVTDALDSVGNTTKAICKGFAIGSAGLAAMALFSAFRSAANLEVISITETRFLIGLFIGGAIVFVFSAYCLEAVGIGAFHMVEEVRRQFREIPNLMEGGAKPDYTRCVDISTRRALKSLIAPGLWAIITPIAIGFTLGAKAVAGLLAGSIVSAFVLALLMAHAGTAWDNAKKFIEAGHFGGKGTLTHAAAVVGDTIGDPFKDTAGPSLDILMKLMSIISVLFATLFIKYLLLP